MFVQSCPHSQKRSESALGVGFKVKVVCDARQYWCFNIFFATFLAALHVALHVALISVLPLQASAEPSGPAPVVSGVALTSTTPEMEARLKKLETELRCQVCMNQTLAESPSGLAGDMRREIRILAVSGKTDEEIKTFLQERYGDFVLYNPRLTIKTYLLWFGPFVLLFGGGVLLWRFARSRRATLEAAAPMLSAEDAKRAKDLLGE